MSIVDILLVVLIAAAALHGLRVGALAQLFTYGGFWLGLVAGALIVAAVVPSIGSVAIAAGVTLSVVLGLAVTLGILGGVLGRIATAGVRRHHLGPVDSAVGVAVSIAALLVSAWLVASFLSQSRYSSVSSAISRSAILREVDRVLPPVPSLFAQVQTFLADKGFPFVFVDIAPPLSGSVPTPSSAAAARIAQGAMGSTYKVLGQACGESLEGTAFVVGPGAVVTNAHVVAGERSTDLVVAGEEVQATVVSFDPRFDIAVLRTGATLGPALTLAPGTVARGTEAAVVGYPEDGPLTVTPAAVAAEVQATGRDIYGTATVTRDVYQLSATIRPGNSGSPVVAANGTVIGVAFSRSTTDPDVGYALTSPGVLARVTGAEHETAAVSTGACAEG